MMSKMTEMEMLMEDSLDGGPPSVGSGDIPTTITSTPGSSVPVTPSTSKKVSREALFSSFIGFKSVYFFFVEVKQEQGCDGIHPLLT